MSLSAEPVGKMMAAARYAPRRNVDEMLNILQDEMMTLTPALEAHCTPHPPAMPPAALDTRARSSIWCSFCRAVPAILHARLRQPVVGRTGCIGASDRA